jgi:hypothetical protein
MALFRRHPLARIVGPDGAGPGQVLRQQPTLWSDVFQAERGWGDFDDNDYVKHDEDEPQQGQGKQLGGWLISNMMTRITTRKQQGLEPGKCDGVWGGLIIDDFRMYLPNKLISKNQTRA